MDQRPSCIRCGKPGLSIIHTDVFCGNCVVDYNKLLAETKDKPENILFEEFKHDTKNMSAM